jgi:hypothetical protein
MPVSSEFSTDEKRWPYPPHWPRQGRPLVSGGGVEESDLISFRKPLHFVTPFFVILRLEKFKKCKIAQFFRQKSL